MEKMVNKSKKYMRFAADDFTGYGLVEGDSVRPIYGDIFGDYALGEKSYSLDKIKYLPPCKPQKIICVGLNYAEHAAESTLPGIPEEPVLFFKPLSALIGNLDSIVIPGWVDRVDYEGELAVIIGQTLKNVSVEEAESGIFGYSCINDVTARNIQKKDTQWTRAKGFDTFCPVGPFIVTGIGSENLKIETNLNGKIVQSANTSQLIKQPSEIISYISKVMTLYPGDILATGTPKGVGPMKEGDEVIITIENIGSLKNSVISENSGNR
jgi:2-keto-4-pentenoate hydratase/2-oxohepta-3-ene-1,7-dioic acid hydratase in catechol pathway